MEVCPSLCDMSMHSSDPFLAPKLFIIMQSQTLNDYCAEINVVRYFECRLSFEDGRHEQCRKDHAAHSLIVI